MWKQHIYNLCTGGRWGRKFISFETDIYKLFLLKSIDFPFGTSNSACKLLKGCLSHPSRSTLKLKMQRLVIVLNILTQEISRRAQPCITEVSYPWGWGFILYQDHSSPHYHIVHWGVRTSSDLLARLELSQWSERPQEVRTAGPCLRLPSAPVLPLALRLYQHTEDGRGVT